MTEPFYYLYCCQPTYIQGFLQHIVVQASPEIKTDSANIRGNLEGKGCWGRALNSKFPKVFCCIKKVSQLSLKFSPWRLRSESHKQDISKLCSGEPRFTSCFHFFLHYLSHEVQQLSQGVEVWRSFWQCAPPSVPGTTVPFTLPV